MPISLRPRTTFAAAALTIVSVSAAAFGATKVYNGPNGGNYGTATNWTPTGVPAGADPEGDDVFLGNNTPSGVSNLTVNLTTTAYGFENPLNSLTLNSTASGLQFMILNQTGATSVMYATTEIIGNSVSDNTYNQSAGTNDAWDTFGENGALEIGVVGINDSYNLSGSGIFNCGGIVTVGVSGSGTFSLSGGNATIDSPGFNAQLNLGLNAGSFGNVTLSGNANLLADDINVGNAGSGVFNESGGTLTAAFINVSSTSGTGVYNYSGGVLTAEESFTVSANGTFNLDSGGTLNAIPTIQTGGVFAVVGGNFGVSGGLVLQGGLFKLQGNSVTTSALTGTSGTVENGALLAAVLTVTDPLIGVGENIPTPFGAAIIDGPSGTLGLTISGGGGLALDTTSNTYSGPTTIQSGILQAGANNAFSPNSNVTLTGGTLDVQAFTETIPSLAGTAGTVHVLSPGSLTVGSNNANTTYAGTFTGNGTLNKTGSGNLTLSGGGSFTGNITVSGGLTVGAVNGIPTGASINFALGGTLNVNFLQNIASLSSGDLNPITFTNSATLLVGAGNVDNAIGGNFSGTGSLVKNGAANLTIGFGSSDNIASTDTTLSVTVNTGTLILSKAAGTNAIAGSLALNGGIVLLAASDQISDASFLSLSGGTFNLNTFNETIGNLSGTAGTLAVGTGTFTVAENSFSTYSGGLTGTGKFVKSGTGNLTLSGSSAFTGGFITNAGRLILQNSLNASAYTANSNGTIQFNANTLNTPGVQILANSGGTIEYFGATISNAFLRGTGTHTILSGASSTFNGVTTFNSTVITQNGPAAFNDFTNGGTLNNNATLTFNGGTNSGTGILNINNVMNTQDFGNSGVINIAAGATLSNSVSNLFLLGGSRTFIGNISNHGGTITLTGGTTLEVNGALLVNDGTITGTTDVNFGGTAEGVGFYNGTVNVTFGGIYQPGFASSALPGNNATLSALTGSGTIDNTSAGPMTLNLVGSSNSAFSGPIQNSTGSTALSIQGTSSLALSTTPLANGSQSVNTYSGGTSVSPGASFIIAATGALPSGSSVLNNGSFSLNANSTIGSLTGTGHTTIAPAVTLTATTSITQNTITNNGTLLLASPTNSLITANFTGSGGITQSTASNTTLIGTYSATGPIALNNGNITFAATANTRQDTGVVLKTSSLSIASTSILDVTNHDLIIGNSNLTTINNEILNGFAAGPGGAAITSSLSTGGAPTFLVPIDATAFGLTSWDNVPVTDPNTIIIKYTTFGDATLIDGLVNADDFGVVISNLGTTTPGTANIEQSWLHGDVNLDGLVNADDFGVIISNLGSAPLTVPPESTSPNNVPEPTALSLLTLAIPLLLRRRKHAH